MDAFAQIQFDLLVIRADVPALGKHRLWNGVRVVVRQLIEDLVDGLEIIAGEQVAFERRRISDDGGAQHSLRGCVEAAAAGAAVAAGVGAGAERSFAAKAGAVVAADAVVATGGAAEAAAGFDVGGAATGTPDRMRRARPRPRQ